MASSTAWRSIMAASRSDPNCDINSRYVPAAGIFTPRFSNHEGSQQWDPLFLSGDPRSAVDTIVA